MKRCDYCGGRLGMVVRRKWSWRFCKLTCKTAFEHRRHEELRRRMRELAKIPGFLALAFGVALTLLPASIQSSLAQSNPTLDCTTHHGQSTC